MAYILVLRPEGNLERLSREMRGFSSGTLSEETINTVSTTSAGEEASGPLSPAIVIHQSEELPESSLISNYDSNESDESPESSIDNVVELARPSRITCLLHITFAHCPLPGAVKEVVIDPTDPNSYDQIEKVSQEHVNDKCREELKREEFVFRYGHCMVIGQDVERCGLPLTSREDWASVCTILSNFLTSNPDRHLHLDIFREYFAFRFRATSEVSFADSKRAEIHALMKRASDRRLYLSREDLMQVTSTDTIRDIIISDSQLDITFNEKERFINSVQREARKLLAMCVLAGLGMGCLKKLLDNGCRDATLPLKNRDCCHTRCAVDFENLISRQGGFSAAVFWIVGQHQKLHSSVVVPIHFYPVNKQGDSPLEKNRRNDSEDTDSTFGTFEEDLARRDAWCGSGAYSNV